MRSVHRVPLAIPNISESQWHDLLIARTEFMLETRPTDTPPSHQAQRQSITTVPELRDNLVIWLLYDDDANCVGVCSIQHPKPESPDYAANKERIYVEPVVRAAYRRQGVASQLLPWLIRYAQEVGASWIQWDTNFESGFRFSEKIGATEAGRQQTNRLQVDQIDWELMQRWADEGQSRNPDVTLIRFVNLPAPSLLASFCDLVTTINHLQPNDSVEGMSYTLTPEELEMQAKRLNVRKTQSVILCTQESDNTLSGMTDSFYSDANPSRARFALTGVRTEFQGRGLAKWLKAAMLLDMRNHYPQVAIVDSDNFDSNQPMLSINHRIGFKLFEQSIFYKIQVNDLAAQLAMG